MRVVVSDDILARHHVRVSSDNEFQRAARLLQALWREKHDLPIGDHRGRPLGSRLAMPFAAETFANYITDTIRQVVSAEVKKPEKLYQAPRIYNDLLSSQPLCFNVFGELQTDLDLATRIARQLWPARVAQVTAIEFEHSPGRGDERYTGDHSAFDVFLERRPRLYRHRPGAAQPLRRASRDQSAAPHSDSPRLPLIRSTAARSSWPALQSCQ